MPVISPASPRGPSPGTEVIWAEFHGRLLGFIARRVDSRETAEDILQDVMVRIHRHADSLERGGAVAGWVYEIARNAIADHYRSARVRKERASGSAADLESDMNPSPAEIGSDADARGELANCVAPLIDGLPPIYAEALRLTDLGGTSQTAAAHSAGVSVSGMKSRVQRGRKLLKRLLIDCCDVELDRRGHPHDCTPRNESCAC